MESSLGVESWIVASFRKFLELILHCPGIVASQVVTLNPVISAPLLARDRFFGFSVDEFGFFGASLSSRFGLLDLLPCGRVWNDGGGGGSCSRAVVLVDEVSGG